MFHSQQAKPLQLLPKFKSRTVKDWLNKHIYLSVYPSTAFNYRHLAYMMVVKLDNE